MAEGCKIMQLQANDIPLGKIETVKQNQTNCEGSNSTFYKRRK
jgi:hypothetical protein